MLQGNCLQQQGASDRDQHLKIRLQSLSPTCTTHLG
jgi:hypothetical protein